MTPRLVYLHSPWVGPDTWTPVAHLLSGDVPDLRSFVVGHEPVERYVENAVEAAERADVVVGHSGAGPFLPMVAEPADAEFIVFVDAGIPPDPGPHPPNPRLLELFGRFDDALRLPPWPTWWEPDVIERLIPDPVIRATFVESCPSVPRVFAETPVEVPPGWTDRFDIRYLRLSFAYDDDLATARTKGWPSLCIDGSHLAPVTDPDIVASALRRLLRVS